MITTKVVDFALNHQECKSKYLEENKIYKAAHHYLEELAINLTTDMSHDEVKLFAIEVQEHIKSESEKSNETDTPLFDHPSIEKKLIEKLGKKIVTWYKEKNPKWNSKELPAIRPSPKTNRKLDNVTKKDTLAAVIAMCAASNALYDANIPGDDKRNDTFKAFRDAKKLYKDEVRALFEKVKSSEVKELVKNAGKIANAAFDSWEWNFNRKQK